jgi:pyridoxine 5-phosphate synthase
MKNGPFFNCWNKLMTKIRLGVNIDHVATLRNARGGAHPCPVAAAKICQKYGVDGITAHLREDRRHIKDEDIFRLKNEVNLPLNFEMAATKEMLEIAIKTKPNAVCLVPEKREELTTEGGLDVLKNQQYLTDFIARLKKAEIRISLFVDPDLKQIEAAKSVGADIVEIHTGKYCLLSGSAQEQEFQNIANAAKQASDLGLECHAGHGLNFTTAKNIAKITEFVEFNIGHFLIGEAIFTGLEKVIKKMREVIKN